MYGGPNLCDIDINDLFKILNYTDGLLYYTIKIPQVKDINNVYRNSNYGYMFIETQKNYIMYDDTNTLGINFNKK